MQLDHHLASRPTSWSSHARLDPGAGPRWLARRGEAQVSAAGGCAIRARPVDLHLRGLERRWAPEARAVRGGFINVPRPAALKGGRASVFDVGHRPRAPENLLMTAALAPSGRERAANAACEPEVSGPGGLASSPWARRSRAPATPTIACRAWARPATAPRYSVIPDRIESGTLPHRRAIHPRPACG